ncbi:MAG: threonine aldolase family protein [Gammaproteobacteria bacterium]|nr:threonine aldolase family protein [Gammaproteobacteria bacterium]
MIPLASDTETRPTAAMRAAMADAEVGDEQKGQDPTVTRLLERVCERLGKEAALFLPSGTMCNLVAIKAHTRPGDLVFVERNAHIARAEAGGAALAAGVQFEGLDGTDGRLDGATLVRGHAGTRWAPASHAPPASLLCLEQTHNYAGGTVWPLASLRAVADTARELGLAVHVDGARLFNAGVAEGVPVADYAACADSVWVDFTKGLGAPLGAVLAGDAAFIAAARRYKHAFGGALRQAGIVAAGCLHALDHHVERLAEDHRRARDLADGLAALPGVRVVNPAPETNIVLFEVGALDPALFLGACASRGVGFSAVGARIRAVTHLDVDDAAVARAVEVTGEVVAERAG